MKSKKRNFWYILEFLMIYGWAILVVLAAVGALIYFGSIGTEEFREDRYCKVVNPDKCVCERMKCKSTFYGIEKCLNIPMEKSICNLGACEICTKFHKLTPQELLKKNCNENPREDENCECLEYKDTDKVIGSYACPDSCREITIKECKIKGLYSYSKEIEYEGNIIFDDYCELNSVFEDGITDARNVTMQIIERNITNCERCYKYEQVCIKSHPKTDYEKYPEDYIIETECVEYEGKFSEIRRDEIFEICYDKEPKLITEKCFDLKNETFKQCFGGGCLNCTDICIRNSTTYRLKNECEKGNPDWVEEEVFDISSICAYLSFENWNKTQHIQAQKEDGCWKTICREKTDVDKLMELECWDLSISIKGDLNYREDLIDCRPHGCFSTKDIKQAFKNKGCEI